MCTHDHVHRLTRPERLARRVTFAGACVFLWTTDADPLLAFARAAELAVLVERLRVASEARLNVTLTRSASHGSNLTHRILLSINNADLL